MQSPAVKAGLLRAQIADIWLVTSKNREFDLPPFHSALGDSEFTPAQDRQHRLDQPASSVLLVETDLPDVSYRSKSTQNKLDGCNAFVHRIRGCPHPLAASLGAVCARNVGSVATVSIVLWPVFTSPAKPCSGRQQTLAKARRLRQVQPINPQTFARTAQLRKART